eukprot:SAG22_NODE_555_length_9124_cov_114.706593_1_plen_147_part_00
MESTCAAHAAAIISCQCAHGMMATQSGWRGLQHVLLFLLSAVAAAAAAEAFRFANTYTDSAVLEHGNASLWGFGEPGAKVVVAVSRGGSAVASASGVVNPSGSWRVSLPSISASTQAATVRATSNGVAVALEDVLFGSVWGAMRHP